MDEMLKDGYFSNLLNGDPIYIVNIKKHEFKKIETINKFFVQGNTITDVTKNFEYKILDQMYRLPDGVKNQKWFRLKVIDQEEKYLNNLNNTNIINNMFVYGLKATPNNNYSYSLTSKIDKSFKWKSTNLSFSSVTINSCIL